MGVINTVSNVLTWNSGPKGIQQHRPDMVTRLGLTLFML